MVDDLPILSKISMIKENLTKKEKLAVEYIIENISTLNNTKIEDLASATKIGYSPIYSLLNKLNFKGYREFIIALSAEQKNLSMNDLNFGHHDDVFNYYVDLLQRNKMVLNQEYIQRTVDAVCRARNIYLVGIGSTGLAARELALKLMRFGFSAIPLTGDEDNIRMQATLAHSNDLYLVFSLTGQSKVAIDAASLAKQNKAEVIAISANPSSELVEHADLMHVVVSSAFYQEGEIYISPILPLLYWFDNLTQALTTGDESRKLINNRLKTNLVLSKKWKL